MTTLCQNKNPFSKSVISKLVTSASGSNRDEVDSSQCSVATDIIELRFETEIKYRIISSNSSRRMRLCSLIFKIVIFKKASWPENNLAVSANYLK